MNNKIFIIVLIVLVAVGAIMMRLNSVDTTNPKSEPQMANFPLIIGDWKGEDMPLRDRDYLILGTKNLIMREYKNEKNGNIVYLYIIYSQDNRKALHPPEICYTGGGANTITEKSVILVTDSLKANKFFIESKDSRQMVVYWFKAANLTTYSYIQQQLKFVLDRMKGKSTSGAMIRVSTLMKDKDQKSALNMIKAFCKEISPLVIQYVP